MALFTPYTTIEYRNPVTEEMRFKTLISDFDDDGLEKRKRKWLYPKRDITLVYKDISLTEGRTLFQFYLDRYGAYEEFVFFKYETETYQGEYIGTGDGSTVIWNLPCKNSTAVVIYLDGTTLTDTVDYTITADGGTDGEDKIELVVAPSSGQRLTMDFVGNLKIRCRFAEDNLSFDTFFNKFRTVGIKLRGLLCN